MSACRALVVLVCAICVGCLACDGGDIFVGGETGVAGGDSSAGSEAGPGTDGQTSNVDNGAVKKDKGTPPPPKKEVCNGFDDDNDGLVDEGCSCKVGSKQACFPYKPIQIQGICKKGQQTCSGGSSEFGVWGPCSGYQLPEGEKCGDGIDQDCDGSDKQCPAVCESFLFAVNSRPVDILWVIDQSGSMNQEIAGVKANMNNFSNYINGQKIDYHVLVMASKTGSYGICIAPPLGGPGCSNGPRFKQVVQNVQSLDSLKLIQKHITAIEAFMRPNSLRQIVEVSDDNSRPGYGYPTGPSFHSWIVKRPGWKDYVFHSIVSLYKDSCTATVGTEYMWLSKQTKGMEQHICKANWNAMFNQLGKKVADLAKTQYKLKGTPNPNTIKVYYNNTLVPKGVNWDYDGPNNQVVLKGKLPGNGTAIKVCYQPQKP